MHDFKLPAGGFHLWAMLDSERPLFEAHVKGDRLYAWGEPLPRCLPIEIILERELDSTEVAEIYGLIRWIGHPVIYQWEQERWQKLKGTARVVSPADPASAASRSASRRRKSSP